MFEINLVPDVKAEMIQTQKKRNVVILASVIVSAIAAGIVVVLLMIKLGQDLTINNNKSKLETMTKKITDYTGLEELLTIQKQLSDIETITQNKTLLSRTFNILHSITQLGDGDEVSISNLSVDLTTYTISFDGQANAGPDTDGNDFRVLERFTKTVDSTKYDYGRYVDRDGNEIPTMCIFESGDDGVPFHDGNRIYAIWAKNAPGCDPTKADSQNSGEDVSSNADDIRNTDISGGCDGADLVCIYRTPDFTSWYRSGYITTDGQIQNIAHFQSNENCVHYSGVEKNGTIVWDDSSNQCLLVSSPIEITSMSNARDAGGDMVLSFSAVMSVSPDVYNFNNKHMIMIGQSGRQNVTDSFIQIGDMFAQRAIAEGEEK